MQELQSKLLKKYPLYLLYIINVAVIIFFWSQSALPLFKLGFDGSMVAIARLAGLLGAYSVLVQFVLISRAKWIDRAFGFDQLTRIHRKNGILAFALISSHIPIMIGGTARLNQLSPPEQSQIFLTNFTGVWLAAIAYAVLILTIVLSVTTARKLLKYETWYFVHLLNYSVVILAFFHQIANGGTLLGNDGFRYYWVALHIGIFANLISARFVSPIIIYYRHRFRVDSVVKEADNTHSIYVTGRNLKRFKYQGGQFAKWRFLHKDFWKEEHPFTISVEPNDRLLRLTPKAIGDYTSKIKSLPVGTPVMVSGPLGVFTLANATRTKLLFIAGGIGITPLRAMLGEPRAKHHDIILLYSAKHSKDIAFKSEVAKHARRIGAKVFYVFSDEKVPGQPSGRLDATLIKQLVPDVSEREVYLCGPPAMMDTVEDALVSTGTDKNLIHAERFRL